jgi:hypothetical protein
MTSQDEDPESVKREYLPERESSGDTILASRGGMPVGRMMETH